MRAIRFGIVAISIGAGAALTSRAATAGGHHHKRYIARSYSEHGRNAQASASSAYSSAREAPYFDEALSPPAGH
jgi:hypothetical protein